MEIKIKNITNEKIDFSKLISVYEGAALGLNVFKEKYEKYKDDWKMILNDALKVFLASQLTI